MLQITKDCSTVFFVNCLTVVSRSKIEIRLLSGKVSQQLIDFNSDLPITSGGISRYWLCGFDCPSLPSLINFNLPPAQHYKDGTL